MANPSEKAVGVASIGLGRWGNTIAGCVLRTPKMKLVTCFTRTAEKTPRLRGQIRLR